MATKSKSTGRKSTKSTGRKSAQPEVTEQVSEDTAQEASTPEPTMPEKQTKNDGAVIDITKLSASDLASLQKQLKEHKQEVSSKRGERNKIITDMIQEKDEEGNFVNTTRDIALSLTKNGLTEFLTEDNFDSEAMKEEVEKEIRKIQAKKQQLEKLTDEKGQLVHPEGKFGYKPSGRTGGGNGALAASKVRVETVLAFFKDRADELTTEQKAEIINALS